ncbi:MAG: thioredoxin domain-containing protein [Leptolyngbyaceae cyanobacterium]
MESVVMTVNRGSDNPAMNRGSRWAIVIIATFAIAAFWLTRPVADAHFSPVSGLMSLKASAQQAMPYQVAMHNGKPTLIEFYADWCTTCQGMAPTLASIHEQLGGSVNWVMLDIDDPQWRDQIQQFHVTGVPHLVLQTGQGAIADSFVGKVPGPILLRSIEQMF